MGIDKQLHRGIPWADGKRGTSQNLQVARAEATYTAGTLVLAHSRQGLCCWPRSARHLSGHLRRCLGWNGRPRGDGQHMMEGALCYGPRQRH